MSENINKVGQNPTCPQVTDDEEEISDRFERLSDEEYYEGHQTGFNFDDSECIRRSGSSQLSSIRRNENLNHYELLQCDGLNEVAENTVSPMNLSSFSTPSRAEIDQIHKTNKCVNPLDMCLKKEVEPPSSSILSSPSSCVTEMVLSGSIINFSLFKAKVDKMRLLKAAVETHDGNSILEVVLFIRNTLKKSLFQKELLKFPDAVNTYLCYLEEEHETDELTNMLLLLDRPEEAAVFKYEAAISVQSPDRKVKLIENCINTHFQPGGVSDFLRESVLEHKICLTDSIALKEHQMTSNIDEDHASKIFEELTGRESLTGSSALDNFIFSVLNFYEVPSIALISPTSIRNRYKLSSKQFTWCVFRVLAAQKRWSEVFDLLLTKTWTGSVKVKPYIPVTQLLAVLSKANAPKEVMEKFISFIEKQHLRLFCAKKYKCHSIAFEILKKNKDRKGLIEYISTLSPNSSEFQFATAALNQMGVNWRN